MRLLIDSNVFLWTAFEPGRLSRRARLAVEDRSNELYVSVVTPWELALAEVKGLLKVDVSVERFYIAHLAALEAIELAVLGVHALATAKFPYTLKDPMDRILAGQSITERMPLVSSDGLIPTLGVHVIW